MTDKASSNAGILQIKGHNRTIGGWQCHSTRFTTTATIQTSNDLKLALRIRLLYKLQHVHKNLALVFCSFATRERV